MKKFVIISIIFICGALGGIANGNISATTHRVGKIGTPSNPNHPLEYRYIYDDLNRLTEAADKWWYYAMKCGYDKNGNMTHFMRLQGAGVEELNISHNGNRLSQVTDITGTEYTWATYSLFDDYSYNPNAQYAYNANGAMTIDPYKGAQYSYNELGMPLQTHVPAIMGRIDYTYSATGERLGAFYCWHSGLSLDPVENGNRPSYTMQNSTKTRAYIGNKVFEDGSLKRILLPNGYYENNNYYFYLRDHLGNNSVVAKGNNGEIMQGLHYYPYGRVIEDESSGLSFQPYKYGGKEDEPMFGLGLYDSQARWLNYKSFPYTLTMDPHAESYYSWSPYMWCGGNPVNRVDPTGMDWTHRNVDDIDEYYYDRNVRSQDDIIKRYGKDSGITHVSSGTTVNLGGVDFQFWNEASQYNEYGAVSDANGNLLPDNNITYGDNYTIFGTTDDSVNAETLHKNWMGSYIGPNNPKSYGNEGLEIKPIDSYQYLPRNRSEYFSRMHDMAYEAKHAKSKNDTFFNTAVLGADVVLVAGNIANMALPGTSFSDRGRSALTVTGFGLISVWKSLFVGAKAAGKGASGIKH